MDKALEMMAEYILEENVSQKKEIRKLTAEREEAEKRCEDLYFRVSKLEENRVKLRKAIHENVKWENGKPTFISIYSSEVVKTIIDILDLYEPNKAIL